MSNYINVNLKSDIIKMLVLLQSTIILMHVGVIYCEFELLILHNNDMRCTLEETLDAGGKYGGLARVAQVVNQARKAAKEKRGPPVIYLDAGDFYNEPIWLNPFTKKIAIEILNTIKPDVASFGCHDLNYGLEHVRAFVKRIKFPLIASNLHFTNNSYLVKLFEPSTILTRGNKRIGVVGYVTPKNHLLLQGSSFYFEDEVTAVTRECEKLKLSDVGLIIALGHSGFDVDMKIAQEVELVDVVIGGLTNTLLWNGKAPHDESPRGPYPIEVTQSTGKKVLLVTTYGFTKYMGSLKLIYDYFGMLIKYEGKPIFLNEKIAEDPTILDLIDTYGSSLRAVNNEDDLLGTCIVEMNANAVRDEESNIGNFILDSFVEFMAIRYRGPYWTDVPLSLMNAGAIRKGILTSKKKPNITKRSIMEVLPFRQRLVVVTLLGSGILETLEAGVRSNGETRGGEFLQVSGIRVAYDYTKPTGKRVAYAKAFCSRCDYPSFEHIDPNKHYNIIVNTFLANAGDGHVAFKARALSLQPIQAYELDVLGEILKIHGTIRPEAEERIVYTNSFRRIQNSSISLTSWNFNSLSLLFYFIYNKKLLQ